MKKKLIFTSFAMGLAILSLASCKKKDTSNKNNKDDTSDTTDDQNKDQDTTTKEDLNSPYQTSDDKAYHFINFYDSAYETDDNNNLKKDNNGYYIINDQAKKIVSVKVNDGTKLSWLPTPVKEGYTFAGWYVDTSLSTPFYYTEMPEADLDIYARWQIDSDTIYVSPTGSPTNDGKKPSNAMSLLEASRVYKPGSKIIIQSGTYKNIRTISFGAKGDANHITTIKGDDVSKTILSFEDQDEADANVGVKIAGNYHNIENLTIQKAGDNGLLLGSSNNTVKNCVFTENHDTGLQIGRINGNYQPNIDQWPANNLVLNCTSFNNCDNEGEDADGFAAKLTVGYNNVFDGCMSYWNVDDGWDLYAKQDSGRIGLVRIQNCIAFQNGRHLNSNKSGLDMEFAGDGNGFKLGGTSVPCEVIVDNCISAYNYAHGFTDNSNPGHIAISNSTSINNGEFASDSSVSATFKEYDNFNLNRDSIVANKNYYSNLLSYYSKNSDNGYYNGKTDKNGSDEFNGSISDVIMIQSGKYYKASGALSAQSGDGFITSKVVSAWTDPSSTKEALDDTDPESLIATYKTTNFHTKLRNSDSSLNINNLWGVKSEYKQSITFGANLSKSESKDYSHYTFTNPTSEETSDQTTVREILNSIDLAINKDLVFNDVYLPTKLRGVTITWTSSNTDALTISDSETVVEKGLNYRYGVLNPRLTADTNVTLTATITVGGQTYTKEFTITAQALDPRIGEISGIDNTTILSSELDSFKLNTYEVKDYTSTTLTLNEGADKDYTVSTSIKYVDDFMSYDDALKYTNYTTVNELSSHGTYLIEYSFNIDGYAPVVKKRVVTVVNDNDTYEVTTASAYLNSIINKKVTLSGDVSYGSGTLYAVAVTRGSAAPTASQIKALDSSYTGYNSAVKTYSLSSRSFSFDLEVSENVAVDVYMVVENSTGFGVIYSMTDEIESAVEISTYEGLTAALADGTKAYVLTQDIDCNNATINQSKDTSAAFKGYFNGNGHTIKNLKISVEGEGGGLFFKATGSVTIINIVLENIHVNQTDINTGNGGKTGVLLGYIDKGSATIDSITAINCSANAYQRTAGIVGEVIGIKNATASQMPTVSITNCSVISNGTDFDNNTIKSLYKSQDANGQDLYTGGKYVGGILAHVQYGVHISVDKCYVKENIYAYNQYSGGIVGRIDPQSTEANISITNCVFAGNLQSTSSYAGGILGGRSSGKVTITNNVCIGALQASNSGAIVSTNLCTATSAGTTKLYTINDYTTFENNYRMIYDYSSDSDYSTETEYLEAMTKNQEWQGNVVYKSILETETWWNTNMAEFMKTYSFNLNTPGWVGLCFFKK